MKIFATAWLLFSVWLLVWAVSPTSHFMVRMCSNDLRFTHYLFTDTHGNYSYGISWLRSDSVRPQDVDAVCRK